MTFFQVLGDFSLPSRLDWGSLYAWSLKCVCISKDDLNHSTSEPQRHPLDSGFARKTPSKGRMNSEKIQLGECSSFGLDFPLSIYMDWL